MQTSMYRADCKEQDIVISSFNDQSGQPADPHQLTHQATLLARAAYHYFYIFHCRQATFAMANSITALSPCSSESCSLPRKPYDLAPYRTTIVAVNSWGRYLRPSHAKTYE